MFCIDSSLENVSVFYNLRHTGVQVKNKPVSDYIGNLFIKRAHVVMLVVHLVAPLAMTEVSRSKVTMTRQ